MAEEEPFDPPREDPEGEAVKRQIEQEMRDAALERAMRFVKKFAYAIVIAAIFGGLLIGHLCNKYSG